MQPPYEPPNPFQPNFWKAKFKIISQSMENSISCPYWHSKFEGERQFCRLDHYVSKEPYSTLIKAHLYATTRALFLVIPNRISRQADDWSGNCTRIFLLFWRDYSRRKNRRRSRTPNTTRNVVHEEPRARGACWPISAIPLLFHPLQNATGCAKEKERC